MFPPFSVRGGFFSCKAFSFFPPEQNLFPYPTAPPCPLSYDHGIAYPSAKTPSFPFPLAFQFNWKRFFLFWSSFLPMSRDPPLRQVEAFTPTKFVPFSALRGVLFFFGPHFFTTFPKIQDFAFPSLLLHPFTPPPTTLFFPFLSWAYK